MNNKMERMWKEQLGGYLGYCPGFCVERLRKAMQPSVRLPGVPINIQNRHLSYRYQKG